MRTILQTIKYDKNYSRVSNTCSYYCESKPAAASHSDIQSLCAIYVKYVVYRQIKLDLKGDTTHNCATGIWEKNISGPIA